MRQTETLSRRQKFTGEGIDLTVLALWLVGLPVFGAAVLAHALPLSAYGLVAVIELVVVGIAVRHSRRTGREFMDVAARHFRSDPSI